MNVDVIVVGAGIVGASTAYFLAREGLSVAIVDRGGVAGGTTGAGEGNILLSDKAPGPELEMARLGCALWAELAHDLRDDFEYDRKGAIVVAETPEQLRKVAAHVAAMSGAGVAARLLDGHDLSEAEPNLARDVEGASYFPDDAQVQPMLAANALVRAARELGAVLVDHCVVSAIDLDAHGAVVGVKTAAGDPRAPRVVVAAGPWSPAIVRTVGLDLPVQPRKGHIAVTEPAPRLVFHKVMEAGYADAVNSAEETLQVAAVVEDTKSGTILLGSSRRLAGFESTVEAPVVQAIVRRALRFYPILATVRLMRAYVGFRAFTPDHLPAVGEIYAAPGLYVNTGHEGAGICLGPISGKLLSQVIIGKTPDLDMSPFSPSRFHGITPARA